MGLLSEYSLHTVETPHQLVSCTHDACSLSLHTFNSMHHKTVFRTYQDSAKCDSRGSYKRHLANVSQKYNDAPMQALTRFWHSS